MLDLFGLGFKFTYENPNITGRFGCGWIVGSITLGLVFLGLAFEILRLGTIRHEPTDSP